MAPNTKSDTTFIDPLFKIELGNLVKSEFLPLTHPSEACSKEPTLQVSTLTYESHEYWNWPTLSSEEQQVDVFSAAYIESNLIQEARHLADKSVEYETSQKLSEDGYWDMPCDNISLDDSRPGQHDPLPQCDIASEIDTRYWDWSSVDRKTVRHAAALDAAEARRVLTLRYMEMILLRHAASLSLNVESDLAKENEISFQSQSQQVAGRSNSAYWDW